MNNLVITPEFYAETLPVVEEMMSRKDAEKFFKMVGNLENTVRPRPSGIVFNDPDAIRRFALLFSTTLGMKSTRNSLKFWKSKKIIKSYGPQILYNSSRTLQHRDSEGLFKNLSLDCQHFYIGLEVDPGSHYIYLRLLTKLGFSPSMSNRIYRFERSKFAIHAEPEEVHGQISAFLNGLVNQSEGKNTSALDFSYPSEKFIAIIRKESLLWEKFYGAATEIFFLLRVVYGEATVLDFIRTVGVDEDRFTPDNILDTIDSWPTLKHYPAEWILKIIPDVPLLSDYAKYYDLS